MKFNCSIKNTKDIVPIYMGFIILTIIVMYYTATNFKFQYSEDSRKIISIVKDISSSIEDNDYDMACIGAKRVENLVSKHKESGEWKSILKETSGMEIIPFAITHFIYSGRLGCENRLTELNMELYEERYGKED